MQRLFTLTIIALLVTVTAGCASRLREDTYSRGQVRQVQKVQTGTVLDVRFVKIEGTKSDIGAAAGGVVGAVTAGRNVGGGSGSIVASVLGSVLGGFIGSVVEEGITRRSGQEITVETSGGRTLAIVQEAEEGVNFRPGDLVKIIHGRSGGRVVPVAR